MVGHYTIMQLIMLPAFTALAAANPLRAQSVNGPSPVERRELAPGVVYERLQDARGPWSMHVVRVDLRRADVAVQAMHARDSLRGREQPSAMARRRTTPELAVLAAINADFFDLKSGENENNQVIDGEWWKGLKVTDSPFDTYDNVHVQFALGTNNRPTIGRFLLDGRAFVRGAMTPIITVNANPTGTPEGSALYTPRFGRVTPRDTTRQTAEAPLTRVGHRGDTALYVRRGAVSLTSGSAIPDSGAILAAYGARAAAVQAMADGDTVRILLTTLPRLPGGAPRLLIGGWPQVLRDGVNVAGDAATVEGTISRNAEVRHPRSAIGYSRDRRYLWLFTVDGRSATSVGMTLVEMADVLRARGVWDAMNFDGGGSTAMVIDGRLVNAPSDPTGERAVGNVLMITHRPSSRSSRSVP